MAQGYLAACPGTEVYRAPNSFEAAILAILLDQAGLHQDAATGWFTPTDIRIPAIEGETR